MFRFGFIGKSGQGLPRTDLVLYLPRENDYRSLDWETEVDWDESMTGYFGGDVAAIRTATGWTEGNANPLYGADGVPLVATRAELEGWAGINTANILFNYPKLAIYATDVDAAVLTKAKAVLKIT
jgi:hypothetical protein